jgi:hypothetical protein
MTLAMVVSLKAGMKAAVAEAPTSPATQPLAPMRMNSRLKLPRHRT